MQLNKIKLTTEASERLKQLKARTGLTPNILCRIGFCLSLRDNAIPKPEKYPEEDREFNRYTLLGEWDDLYVSLLTQWCDENSATEHELEAYFRSHINRGVEYVSKSVKSIGDVASLLKST